MQGCALRDKHSPTNCVWKSARGRWNRVEPQQTDISWRRTPPVTRKCRILVMVTYGHCIFLASFWKWELKELGRGLSRLCARLGRCCVEFHWGTVLGKNFDPVSRKIKENSVPETVHQCSSTQHKLSVASNYKMGTWHWHYLPLIKKNTELTQ